MNIQFLSIDGRKQATAVIDNTDKYNLLWSGMSEPEGLSEYTLFEPADTPIYLPKNQVEMVRRSLGVKTIDPNMLVNALFSNPSLVSTNIGEAYYTDGQRGMSVLKEGRSLEFINPRSEEHTSELQSRGHLVCRLLLEKNNPQGDNEV